MQASYRITEDDYVRAGALHGQTSIWFRVVLTLVGMLAVGIVLWMQGSSSLVVICGVIGGGIGMQVGSRFGWMGAQSRLLRRHYRAYKAMQDVQGVSLSDEGVLLTSVMGEGRLTWDKILKWRCNADYVLIYPAPNVYYTVPTSVTAQGFDIERLKAELTRHVGPAQ